MDNLPEQTPQSQSAQADAQNAPAAPTQPTVNQPQVTQSVVQPTQPKKKPILKIFAVLAVFLFLVLASELAYYFFTTKRKEAGQEPLTAQIPQQLQPGKTTPTPTPPEEKDIIGGAIDFEKVDGIFAPLTGFTKEIYQEGEVKLVLGGKVTEVTFDKEGEEGLKLRLQTTTLPTTEFGINFTNEKVETLTILASRDGQLPEPLAVENISIGDIIKITLSYKILDKQGENLILIEVERGGEG